MRFIVTLLFMFMASLAAAQTSPFLPPAGFATATNSAQGVQLNGDTSAAANWTFMQSGGPTPMAPFSLTGAASWASQTAATQVYANDLTGTWQASMRQDGADAACLTPAGLPSEFDLFIQPVNFDKNLGQSLNPAYASNTDFPMLSQLSSMTLSGTFTLLGDGEVAGKPCAVNQASAKYGIVLSDTMVSPPQMLWYQVQLAAFCVPTCRPRPAAQWFWTGAAGAAPNPTKNRSGQVVTVNFGISDLPISFGGQEATNNTPLNLRYALLPRLAGLISAGTNGIDPNLAHWRLAGVNYGDSVWGNTVLYTGWQGFTLNWVMAP